LVEAFRGGLAGADFLEGPECTSSQSTISIVFLAVEDPVKLGWVRSLNLPGGDMTGIYLFAPELEAKRLGLLS